MLLLYNAITSIYTCARSIAYSCVDMCECTNHVRSHDHTKQMIALLIYIIDHVLSMSV